MPEAREVVPRSAVPPLRISLHPAEQEPEGSGRGARGAEAGSSQPASSRESDDLLWMLFLHLLKRP